MAFKLSQMTRVKPSALHQGKAVAQVAQVRAKDAADLKTKALAKGFVEAPDGRFTHEDGSWLAMVDGKVLRGLGNEIIDGTGWLRAGRREAAAAATLPALPLKAADFGTPVKAHFAHGLLALAKVSPGTTLDPALLAADAAAAGFVKTRPNFYQHRDGSWVGQLDGPEIRRGVGKTLFHLNTGVLNLTNKAPIAPNRLAPTTALASVAEAVAATGVAANAELLKSKGFVSPFDGHWTHPDDSWVAQVGGETRMGFGWEEATLQSFLPMELFKKLRKYSDVSANTSHDTFHATLAIGELPWPLPLSDLAALKKVTAAKGFTEVEPFFFKHSDGSWVRMLDDLSVRYGYNEKIFYGQVQPLRSLPIGPAGRAQRQTPLGAIIDEVHAKGFAASASLLEQREFVKKSENFYEHADGTWVAQVGGELWAGHGAYMRLVPMSYEGAITRLAPGPNGFAKPPAKPGDVLWDWYMQHTALGRTPLLKDDAATRETLATIGYEKGVDAQGREQWKHPDSSYATFAGTTEMGSLIVELGYNGWTLGELPFNNRKP